MCGYFRNLVINNIIQGSKKLVFGSAGKASYPDNPSREALVFNTPDTKSQRKGSCIPVNTTFGIINRSSEGIFIYFPDLRRTAPPFTFFPSANAVIDGTIANAIRKLNKRTRLCIYLHSRGAG
jgi:hypothetical protein